MNKDLRQEIEKLFEDFNDWGYQYRMSDYATSFSQEEEMEKEGKKDIEKLKNKLLSLVYSHLEKKIPNHDLIFFDKNDDRYKTGFLLGFNQAISEIKQILKEELK